jgi:hypothetical protein
MNEFVQVFSGDYDCGTETTDKRRERRERRRRRRRHSRVAVWTDDGGKAYARAVL